MTLEPYRRVLALPGVRSLLLVSLLARLPVTAVVVTLTLHVVLDLERGYGAAGLVGAAITAGAALGAPVLGRFVDRYGLRPIVGAVGALVALGALPVYRRPGRAQAAPEESPALMTSG